VTARAPRARPGARRAVALAAALVAGAACGTGPEGDGAREDPCAFASGGAPWLAYASAEGGDWDVRVIRADGTCGRALSTAAGVDVNPAWARGGVVAYESDRAPRTSIWLHDVAAGTERRVDVGDLRAMTPAFSPDGARLVFEGRPPGATVGSIYAVPTAGGAPVELTPEATPHGNGGPVFSPDGASVYFVSNRSGAYEVFRVPAAGGAAEQVTAGSGIVGRPAISPDGATLAFARAAGGSTEVVRYALATGAVTPLGVPAAAAPAFHPAGGALAVRVFHGGSANVDLVDLNGGGRARVTAGGGPDGAPAFAPP
jgi:TolB protein